MRTSSSSLAFASNNHRLDASFFDDDEQEILDQRLIDARRKVLEAELLRPPTNTDLSPIETVQTILEALLQPYDPLPDSGFRLLLNTATSRWKSEMLNAVGASEAADPDIVASALGSSIGRPHNKYAILISSSSNDDDDSTNSGDSNNSKKQQSSSSSSEYVLRFAGDPLDFDDGTCWVECMMMSPTTDELLVMTGWDLRQRQDDGVWLVDRIYWQDFREEFMSQNKIEYLVA